MINNENTVVINGGPANPVGQNLGISIRDYFAAAIAQGIYASNINGYEPDMQAIAERAFAQADILLTVQNENVTTPYSPAFIVPEPPAPPEPVIEQPVIEVTRV